mgnify:CR=1 FL=1
MGPSTEGRGRRYCATHAQRVLRDMIDRLGYTVATADRSLDGSFSLAPGSINAVLHGRSGAIYTGREMG